MSQALTDFCFGSNDKRLSIGNSPRVPQNQKSLCLLADIDPRTSISQVVLSRGLLHRAASWTLAVSWQGLYMSVCFPHCCRPEPVEAQVPRVFLFGWKRQKEWISLLLRTWVVVLFLYFIWRNWRRKNTTEKLVVWKTDRFVLPVLIIQSH